MSSIFNQLLNVKGTVVEDVRIVDSPLRPEPVLEVRVRARSDAPAAEGGAAGMTRAAACAASVASVFCQVGVGRFGVSFSPCERRVSGRFGVGRSCWLLVIALVIA